MLAANGYLAGMVRAHCVEFSGRRPKGLAHKWTTVHNRSSWPCLTLSAKHLALHSKTKRRLKTHINKEIASLINELQIKAKSG